MIGIFVEVRVAPGIFFNFNARESQGIKIETVAGVKHVYNPDKPQKGELTLELEKVFEFDSLTIDKEQPPFFSQFNHSGDRLFFFDANQYKIYFFDTAGKLLNQLKIKGQGPGEIERVTQFTWGLWVTVCGYRQIEKLYTKPGKENSWEKSYFKNHTAKWRYLMKIVL